MTSRIGVYGGMFDPVHCGHIRAANYAARLLELDRVLLIPCAIPNHRGPAAASPDQRVSMLRLAIQGRPKLEVDCREIERPGVSYAVETLQSLRDELNDEQLVFILGLDSFNTLPQWHEWQRLFDLAHLLVLNRQDGSLSDSVCQQIDCRNRLVNKPAELFNKTSGNIWFAEEFAIDVSSSSVRDKLRANEGTGNMIDEKVSLFIEDNRLYR